MREVSIKEWLELQEGKLPGGRQTFSWKNKKGNKTGVMVVGRDKSKRKPIKKK